ncbi:MAG: hypothetical protein LBF97_01975, partial [Elusimicrobiota bacterium]|nr:hypothetical protein [Elusimicrobiota bacterium]
KDVAKYFGDSVGRMDLGIIKVTNNGLFDYDSLSQNSIIDKIRKKPHSIKNNGIKNVVPLSTIINRKRGKGSKFILTKGGYYKTLNEAIEDLLSRNNNQGSALKEGKLHRFSFNTLTEAKNCWEFMQLKSFRAVCSLIFFDVNIKKDYLPLVNDYKKSWTDMDFYKYFGITKQEQQVLSLIIKEKNL